MRSEPHMRKEQQQFTAEEIRKGRMILVILAIVAFAIMCALGAIFGHGGSTTPTEDHCEQNWRDYGATSGKDHYEYVKSCVDDTNSSFDQTGQ